MFKIKIQFTFNEIIHNFFFKNLKIRYYIGIWNLTLYSKIIYIYSHAFSKFQSKYVQAHVLKFRLLFPEGFDMVQTFDLLETNSMVEI